MMLNPKVFSNTDSNQREVAGYGDKNYGIIWPLVILPEQSTEERGHICQPCMSGKVFFDAHFINT